MSVAFTIEISLYQQLFLTGRNSVDKKIEKNSKIA